MAIHKLLRKLPLGEILKFAVAGGVNTLVHLGVYFLLIAFAVPPVPASVPAFVTAVVVSYWLNRNWVFLSHGSHLHQFTKFVAVALSGLGINIGLMYLTVEAYGLDHRLGLALTVLCLAAWSYSVNKLWTFGDARPSVRPDASHTNDSES